MEDERLFSDCLRCQGDDFLNREPSIFCAEASSEVGKTQRSHTRLESACSALWPAFLPRLENSVFSPCKKAASGINFDERFSRLAQASDPTCPSPRTWRKRSGALFALFSTSFRMHKKRNWINLSPTEDSCWELYLGRFLRQYKKIIKTRVLEKRQILYFMSH